MWLWCDIMVLGCFSVQSISFAKPHLPRPGSTEWVSEMWRQTARVHRRQLNNITEHIRQADKLCVLQIQTEEHGTCNAKVMGSIPMSG